MKLVDVLARELKVWPEGYGDIGQAESGRLHVVTGWDLKKGWTDESFSQAEDFTSAVVARAEWQAAVDALNAPKVVAWDGVGLPPVGAECEMKRLDYVDVDWQQIKFLCAGEKKAFFMDSEGYEWSRPFTELKFRPIRNAEQVAAEEREKAIKEMMMHGVDAGDSTIEYSCAALYDAGYRKEPKPCGS